MGAPFSVLGPMPVCTIPSPVQPIQLPNHDNMRDAAFGYLGHCLAKTYRQFFMANFNVKRRLFFSLRT